MMVSRFLSSSRIASKSKEEIDRLTEDFKQRIYDCCPEVQCCTVMSYTIKVQIPRS